MTIDLTPRRSTPVAQGASGTPDAPVSMFDELSLFLLWLSKRWPALGLGGLVMAMLLWIDFIRLFDLPVSFISPGMLSALPILGLSVGVPIVSATLFVALMAFVLWQPLHADGPSVVGWAAAQGNAQVAPEDGTEIQKRPDVFMRWVLLCVVHALYWILYVAVVMLHLKPSGDWVWFFGLLLPEIYAFATFWPVFRAASRTQPSWWYLLMFGGAVGMQTAVAGLLFVPLVSSARGAGVVGIALHLEAYFCLVVGIAIVQLVTAKLVLLGWRRGLLRKVFLFVMAIIIPVIGFPDIGGEFASYRLLLSGPGHSPCMVLVFRQGQVMADTVPRPLLADATTGRSVPLHFALRLDDQYYVKERPQAGQTWSVPVASVAGFDVCPKPPGES